jgi:hypothetical protein
VRDAGARRPTGVLVGAAALVLAAALDVWATAALARAMGPANDLFPRWYGARAWIVEGSDPYSAAVSDGIRRTMGGAPGESLGAFVFGFVYPGYVALLLFPLAVLPFTWAATIWLLLAQAATGAGAWLSWQASGVEGRQAPRPAGKALVLAMLFPATLFNLVFGQFAALVFLALAGAWCLLAGCARDDRSRPAGGDLWAGLLLALAFVKPSVALLPVAALLLWCVRVRRYRVIVAAAAAGAVLVGASLLALPGWPDSFWRSTVDYARVAGATSTAGLLASIASRSLPEIGAGERVPLAAMLGVAAVAATGAGWWRSRRRAGDALAAGVLLGAWLVPPLYEWNSVLLLLPLLAWLRDRRGRWQGLAMAAVLAAGALTVPLIFRWPSETRALWPTLVLAGWTTTNLRRPTGPEDAGPAMVPSPSRTLGHS